jgi:hypothetical protein
MRRTLARADFHAACIDQWFATKRGLRRSCPLCKADPLAGAGLAAEAASRTSPAELAAEVQSIVRAMFRSEREIAAVASALNAQGMERLEEQLEEELERRRAVEREWEGGWMNFLFPERGAGAAGGANAAGGASPAGGASAAGGANAAGGASAAGAAGAGDASAAENASNVGQAATSAGASGESEGASGGTLRSQEETPAPDTTHAPTPAPEDPAAGIELPSLREASASASTATASPGTAESEAPSSGSDSIQRA